MMSLVWKRSDMSLIGSEKDDLSVSKDELHEKIDFSSLNGSIFFWLIPKGTTIYTDWRLDTIIMLHLTVKNKRPGTLSQWSIILHHNAKPHVTHATQYMLQDITMSTNLLSLGQLKITLEGEILFCIIFVSLSGINV